MPLYLPLHVQHTVRILKNHEPGYMRFLLERACDRCPWTLFTVQYLQYSASRVRLPPSRTCVNSLPTGLPHTRCPEAPEDCKRCVCDIRYLLDDVFEFRQRCARDARIGQQRTVGVSTPMSNFLMFLVDSSSCKICWSPLLGVGRGACSPCLHLLRRSR